MPPHWRFGLALAPKAQLGLGLDQMVLTDHDHRRGGRVGLRRDEVVEVRAHHDHEVVYENDLEHGADEAGREDRGDGGEDHERPAVLKVAGGRGDIAGRSFEALARVEHDDRAEEQVDRDKARLNVNHLVDLVDQLLRIDGVDLGLGLDLGLRVDGGGVSGDVLLGLLGLDLVLDHRVDLTFVNLEPKEPAGHDKEADGMKAVKDDMIRMPVGSEQPQQQFWTPYPDWPRPAAGAGIDTIIAVAVAVAVVETSLVFDATGAGPVLSTGSLPSSHSAWRSWRVGMGAASTSLVDSLA
eukprot:CAMPEP_0119479918 /NCGR_PEP_ID=MMETSP1344-20130328/8964_1 /TAXON_ID=236787 /ORGANISM="Florenciella parvula, Strain CCMP2471" /LENGTH=295 /DNA_ID=CAMNT_0007514193 /DNA_START=143 /DNA_END=1032 /DNA_ORIENTATION=+